MPHQSTGTKTLRFAARRTDLDNDLGFILAGVFVPPNDKDLALRVGGSGMKAPRKAESPAAMGWAIGFSWCSIEKVQTPAEYHDAKPEQRHGNPKVTNEQDREAVRDRAARYAREQLGLQKGPEVARRKEERKNPASGE